MLFSTIKYKMCGICVGNNERVLNASDLSSARIVRIGEKYVVVKTNKPQNKNPKIVNSGIQDNPQ